jgi:hypothetical protein
LNESPPVPVATCITALLKKITQTWHAPPLSALFGQAPLKTWTEALAHTQDWTASFGAAQSGMEAPERGEAAFARFEALNRQVFETFAAAGKITLAYSVSVTLGKPKDGDA